jgi:DNA modification methylase
MQPDPPRLTADSWQPEPAVERPLTRQPALVNGAASVSALTGFDQAHVQQVGNATLYLGDAETCLAAMPEGVADALISSPPFWRQRDYDAAGQIGVEPTPREFAERLVAVMRAARRVLTPNGCVWLELGDTYAAGGNGGGGSRAAKRRKLVSLQARTGWRKPPPGYKEKDLSLAPFIVADMLRADGWYLRQVIVWNKGTATEPPRLDRPSVSHSYIFLLSARADSCVRDPGEAWFHSSVWTVSPAVGKSAGDHPAALTPEIARRCIVASVPEGGTVIDPFLGSGTTAAVALAHGRKAIGVELNPEYMAHARARIEDVQRQGSLILASEAA